MSNVGSCPNIVSFARAVPYVGVPHAGGSYLRSHLAVLSEYNHVDLVVPGTSRNESDRAKLDLPIGLHVVPRTTKPAGIYLERVLAFIFPILAPWYLVRAIGADDNLRALIRSADIVEFQWSEYTTLARYIKRINPDAVLVGIAHDILMQKYSRRAGTSKGLARLRARLGLLTTRLLEPRSFQALDKLCVFSAKDRDLLPKRVQARTVVINPPITASSTGTKINGRILFTGALSRPENDEAIRWFIETCWDQVTVSIPRVSLFIAGAEPSAALTTLVENRGSVHLSGYIPDLDGIYPTGDIFINPVRAGAGVKFKTITAMLYGLPVVSTSVGAEGVGSPAEYFAIADDSSEFSSAVIAALSDSESASRIGERAQQWASQKYGLSSFRVQLHQIYKKE